MNSPCFFAFIIEVSYNITTLQNFSLQNFSFIKTLVRLENSIIFLVVTKN